MIRFVDLTAALLSDSPVCGFFDTIPDRFIENHFGCHDFDSMDDIERHPRGERMLGLIPPGFFSAERCQTCEGNLDDGRLFYADRGPLCSKCHDMAIEIDEKT